MKKEYMKKIIIVMTLLFVLFTCFSCSDKTDKDYSVKTDTYLVYEQNSEDLDFSTVDGCKYCEANDSFIVLKNESSVNKYTHSVLARYSETFELINEIDLSLKENERINNWDMNSTGDIIAYIVRTDEKNDETDPDNNYRSIIERTYYLKLFKANDNTYKDLQIPEFTNGNISVSDVFLSDDMKIILNVEDYENETCGFYVLDENCKIEENISCEDAEWIESITKKAENISFVYYSDEKKFAGNFDISTSEITKMCEISCEEKTTIFYGNNNELFLCTSEYIGKINSDGIDIICDLNMSGFNGTGIYDISVMPDDSFLILEYDLITKNGYMYKMKKTDGSENDYVQKEEITFGAEWIPDIVKSKIANYNKISNNKYRIKIVDYGSASDPSDQLEKDFISGKAPDIVLYSSFENGKILEKKGAFADLFELMEKDTELNKDDILPFILDAYQNNGKIYSLPAGFDFSTLTVLKKYSDNQNDWNLNKLIEIYDKQSDNLDLFEHYTRSDMVFNVFYGSIDDYVDYDAKTCSFDSEDFIEFLDFVKKFNKEKNQKTEDDYSLFKNGKIILDSISISSFDDYHRLVAGRYKDMDISFSGYPGKNGGHALITSDISLAINSQSGNITAAWDILKEFYMYDFQKELDDCFPTNKKAFYEAGSKAMIPEKDDSGNVLPVYFHDGSESIEIGYLTEEEKNDCIDFVYAVPKTASARTKTALKTATEPHLFRMKTAL